MNNVIFLKFSLLFIIQGISLIFLYPTGQKYSLELMFAKFATVKIAKDQNPLKINSNRFNMPENNTTVL